MKKRILAALLGLVVTAAIPFATELALPEPAKELKTILRDIQDMGYTLEDANFMQEGDADFAYREPYFASSLFETLLHPGDIHLSIYQYKSAKELKMGSEKFSRFLTMASVLGHLDFYRTERNYIICSYLQEQEEFYQPVREYLENFTEESLQK